MRPRLLTFSIIALIMHLNCRAEKYVSNFKNIKKSIDTLTILPLNVEIFAIESDRSKNIDEGLTHDIKEQLTAKTLKMLSRKYIMIHDSTVIDYNNAMDSEISELIKLIKSSQNPIDGIKIPNVLEDLTSQYSNDFFLLLFFRGHYTIGIQPEESVVRDKIYIPAQNFAGMELDILMIDKAQQRVLYFEDASTRDDPRLSDLVERIILRAMKTVYYK
jgi:hypothetical protein